MQDDFSMRGNFQPQPKNGQIVVASSLLPIKLRLLMMERGTCSARTNLHNNSVCILVISPNTAAVIPLISANLLIVTFFF